MASNLPRTATFRSPGRILDEGVRSKIPNVSAMNLSVRGLIVCGGTFDHFHKGHESLLRLAFAPGERVIIGVTSDDFVKSDKRKAKSEKQIESFKKRRDVVLEFVKKEKASDRIEVIEISDLFGPTLSKELVIDAIVVSEDTKKGAEIINQKRKEMGLKDLNILVAPQVLAEDGKLISSARIRNGEINRQGKLYVKPEWLKHNLVLPENLRQEFAKPLGEIVEDFSRDDDSSCVITVGDATTKKFNENFIKQEISVVDFKIAREERYSSFQELGFRGGEEIFIVNNPAGHITSELFLAIAKIFNSNFQKRIIIKIAGEDDLTVLPLILISPLGTSIYYGQPPLRQGFAGQAGLVRILVSEESKEKAYSLVLKLNLV